MLFLGRNSPVKHHQLSCGWGGGGGGGATSLNLDSEFKKIIIIIKKIFFLNKKNYASTKCPRSNSYVL